jgi:hypothetical protein
MMAEAAAGRVSAIYAYDQDRLARDLWIFAGLLRAADRNDFAIVTPAGDLTAEDRRDFVEMRGVMDGGELRKITKRNRAVRDRCMARGDRYGAVPFGYARRTPKGDGSERVEVYKARPEAIARVVEAYRTEGTYQGAARRLNLEGFRSDRGNEWHSSTVRDTVRREAPELVKDVRKGTRGPARKRYLAGLLRCPCGNTLTPGGALTWPLYYCHAGQRGRHAKPHHVAEKALMEWIRTEAARFRGPEAVIVEGEEYDDSADRRALEALRGRIADGVIEAGIADLDAKRAAHGERIQSVQDVPAAIDWESWTPEAVNRVLRAYWEHVELGADLLPVRAEWRLPEEYVA